MERFAPPNSLPPPRRSAGHGSGSPPCSNNCTAGRPVLRQVPPVVGHSTTHCPTSLGQLSIGYITGLCPCPTVPRVWVRRASGNPPSTDFSEERPVGFVRPFGRPTKADKGKCSDFNA